MANSCSNQSTAVFPARALVVGIACLLCLLLAAPWSALEGGAQPDRVLRHVVLFKFKDGLPAEQVREIEQAFAALPGKVDMIQDFEWGTDVSVENLSQGFTHCFVVTFRDKKGRDAYLPHPAHQTFIELVKPRLDKVMVVDYWATRS